MSRLFYFAIFNSLSFEIIGGQILILFARQVGASLMQIGLLASFLPFASVIQLAVAPLVNRFGPKAVMFTGWSARTVVAGMLLGVPWTARQYGPEGATTALLVIMALFYLFRALGMSSWLPLLQEIVPSRLRGEYLGKQEVLRHVSIITASLLTAVYLLGAKGTGAFLSVLALGVLIAAVGLVFLSGLPHIAPAQAPLDRRFLRQALQPLRDPVFRRYLAFSGALRFAGGSVPAFIVLFLRDHLHLEVSLVLFVTTLSSVGAAVSLISWGRLVDRFGSRPVLLIGIVGTAGVSLLWATVQAASSVLAVVVPVAALLLGVFSSGAMVALIRLELVMIPREGREHYVAVTVTLSGIATGLAPLAGGALLHALEGRAWRVGPVGLDAYSIYFLSVAAAYLLPLALRRAIREEPSDSIRQAVHESLSRIRRRLRVGRRAC